MTTNHHTETPRTHDDDGACLLECPPTGDPRPCPCIPGAAYRHTADTITDDDLDDLYAERDQLAHTIATIEKLATQWAILRTHGGAAYELRDAIEKARQEACETNRQQATQRPCAPTSQPRQQTLATSPDSTDRSSDR